jgi:hypothetical protein
MVVMLARTKPQGGVERVEGLSSAFDFLLGDWEVEMQAIPESAPIGPRATLGAYRFLDGTAILDEWRHFNQAEDVVFRGASFRTLIPGTDHWYVVWMMAGAEGYSELTARLAQGELRTKGRGRVPVASCLSGAGSSIS